MSRPSPLRASAAAAVAGSRPLPHRRWWWAAALLALLLLSALGWWSARWLGGPVAAPAAAAEQPQAQPAPLPVLDYGQWLQGRAVDWRVGWLKEEPAVMVIEFPHLAEQGAAMNRLAALLEKAGAPRDRVLDPAELARLIAQNGDSSQTFYHGHDYGSVGLARFFSLAAAQQRALTAQEGRLLKILLDAGMLAPAGPGEPGYISPRVRALITFTATQADDPATPANEAIDEVQRESILRHEASHGRYYTRPGYQAHSRRFWQNELSEAQRERIRAYLASSGYNRDDEDLMLNEAQAFLFNTPDRRAFLAQDIGMSPPQLDALRERFWRTLPAE